MIYAMPSTAAALKDDSGLASSARLIQYLSAMVLALSFIFSAEALPEMNLCAINAATGLQCPGCGLTRAFCAISHGEFAFASKLNPLSLYIYALAVLGLAYRYFVDFIPENLFRMTVIVSISAFACAGIARIFIDLNFF